MIFRQLMILATTLLLGLNCEVAGDTTASDNESAAGAGEYDGALIVKNTENMADCNDESEGRLYYIIDLAEFQYCDGTDYTTIDLSGEDGTDGTDGVVSDFTNVSAKLKLATNQTLNNVTFTPVTYPDEELDNGDVFSSGNPSRFTITEAGVYFVSCSLQFDANATGSRNVSIRADGAGYLTGTTISAAATGVTAINTHVVNDFDAGQYIECIGYQASGGNLDLQFSEYQIFKISE